MPASVSHLLRALAQGAHGSAQRVTDWDELTRSPVAAAIYFVALLAIAAYAIFRIFA